MLFVCLSLSLAQSPPDLNEQAGLAEIRERHLALQPAGMGVLAGWGGANLVAGGIGWAATEPGRARAFWRGNAAWNVVNLGIAGASLASVPAKRRASLDRPTVERQVRGLETALAVNAGLDIGHVLTGLILRHVGRRAADDRLRGFGDALLLQGGFLLAFDLSLYRLSRRRSRALRTPSAARRP